jgi:hypothetical protein
LMEWIICVCPRTHLAEPLMQGFNSEDTTQEPGGIVPATTYELLYTMKGNANIPHSQRELMLEDCGAPWWNSSCKNGHEQCYTDQ